MLVLSRKELQRIILSNGVTLTVLKIQGMRDGVPIQPRVRIGIEAPDDVSIWREEVYEAIQRDNGGEHGRAAALEGK